MTFKDNFTMKDRIELLERWVLVQSYIYYELNDNVSSDFNYDNNVRQLVEFIQAHPDEFQSSRYYPYFDDFDPDCTSGFNLLQKVKKTDPYLYLRLGQDSHIAIREKDRRKNND